MMMFLLYILHLWSLCQAKLSDISQPASFQAVKLGDAVTLTCHIHHAAPRIRVWYKLTTRRRLQLVASTDTLYNLTTFRQPSHHFLVQYEDFTSHLIISRTTWEDVGMYYCGVLTLYNVQFGQGIFLMIKGATVVSDSVIQQPESQSVQSGESVTLSCFVLSAQSAAEHTSIMWLKNSDHSAPEMIYSSGNKNSCQRNDSGETTCVYSLLLRNISLDDTGTYYCTVTSCGETVFGNGTRVKIHSAALLKSLDMSPAFIAMMLLNILLGIVTLVLIWAHYKNLQKDPQTSSRSNNGHPQNTQTGDEVVYASVSSVSRITSCRSVPVNHDKDMVIYSDVVPRRMTGFHQKENS